ncbi:GrpB family protein [Clostridium sp. AM58-1XD]|uniref:GrpB family protein n=1 Tax=Clostridium sp. AM58-1XD TaxID=2292307 RepID=UPI000E4DC99B|nr:GrpB family protein [Clostridium sp. AM58-1XD]RGZ00446.1 GrpB family protein [Clostridium sp. AM58-1XD]
MTKKLEEMTLEELWELFPINLTEHRECWNSWYEEEKSSLEKILPEGSIKRLSHVGSTSVEGIWAKPIVDMLLEMNECDWNIIRRILTENGYLCMAETENRLIFNKGYTCDGFADRVFHLHVRRDGDHDELYFRDYLRKHPETAAEYQKMKMELKERYMYNRDAYTEGKTDFVKRYTTSAKKMYSGRYE